jgi:hypothetical protein
MSHKFDVTQHHNDVVHMLGQRLTAFEPKFSRLSGQIHTIFVQTKGMLFYILLSTWLHGLTHVIFRVKHSDHIKQNVATIILSTNLTAKMVAPALILMTLLHTASYDHVNIRITPSRISLNKIMNQNYVQMRGR